MSPPERGHNVGPTLESAFALGCKEQGNATSKVEARSALRI